MRQKARTDVAHSAIRDALRRVGCSVHDTSQLGGGFPDLTVRTPDGFLLLLEVKSPRGRLTADQERFRIYFPETQVAVTVEDALRLVGVHSERKANDANT